MTEPIRILTVAISNGYESRSPHLHRVIRDALKTVGLEVAWTQSGAGCGACRGHGWVFPSAEEVEKHGCLSETVTCAECGGTGKPKSKVLLGRKP